MKKYAEAIEKVNNYDELEQENKVLQEKYNEARSTAKYYFNEYRKECKKTQLIKDGIKALNEVIEIRLVKNKAVKKMLEVVEE